jgi:hypothetical protein
MSNPLLKQFSTDELKNELRRRDIYIETQPPISCENPDFSEVLDLCKVHILDISRNETDEDTIHYIYEAAMEAIYGQDIWQWINKQRN